MHVKTKCKHFTWKKTLLIAEMNKVDQNMLMEPNCDLSKLIGFLNCPKNCEWYEH